MRQKLAFIALLVALTACGGGGGNQAASAPSTSPAAVLQVQAVPSSIESSTNTSSSVAAKAVDLTDAIAILKMIVGLDVNAGGAPLTSYQAYAADIDGNGKVELSDAISVLKRIVGLETATANWMFFNGLPTVADKLKPGLPPTVSAAVGLANNVNMTAVLRGDVVSSSAFTYNWALTSKPTGSSAAITDTSAVNPSFKADVAGAYVATMTITDGSKNVATSSVTLTACNASSNTSSPFSGCSVVVTDFSQSGVATNGHLSGATVVCEADKSTVTTDANGAYEFPKICAGDITVSGGINVDTGEEFLGELKAPKGATAVNSLTTMMVVGGLTEAEVKTSLGLPSSVSLLTTDPAAENGAAYSNSELFAKAKTVQQLLQTTMDTVATTSSVTDTEAKKAIYATAASSLASQIKAAPATKLITGASVEASVVSEDVVKSMVTNAVTSMKASNNAKLAGVKTGLNTVQPAAIAALAAPSMATQSQQYMANKPATVAAGQSMAGLIQKDQTLANQINSNKSFLAATDATKVAGLATEMKTLVTASNNPKLSNDERQTAQDSALTSIGTAQATAATNTGIAAPAAATNFLAISKDAVAIKSGSTNSKITIADFVGTGATLKWPLLDGTELGVSLLGVGTPVVSAIEVAVEITQPSKSGAFKAYISGLTASISSSGLRIQSTSSAKMIAWGRNDAGAQELYADLSAEVSNIDTTLSSSANLITYLPLNSALERAILVTGDAKGVIKKLSGTFNVSVVVKGLPLRMSNQTPFKEYTISVPKSLSTSAAQTLTGPGLKGKVILTP